MDQRPRRLLDQTRDGLREKGYSIHTERSYVDWIRRFILFHDKRHPREMGAPEMGAYITHLAVALGVAASTQQQALSALSLLYREVLEQERGPASALRSQRPQYLPAAVLTPTEVKHVISSWRPVMARSTVKPGRGLG